MLKPISVSLSLVLAAAALHPASTVAQQAAASDQVPQDMRQLMIFESDPGKTSFIDGSGVRSLNQYRSTLTKHPGYCNNVANVVWSTLIIDFGKSAQGKEIAHQQFEVYRNDRRKLQKLKSETLFAGADEGLVFEFDWRNRSGNFLCGNFTRETLFRIGNWMVLTSEDFWNETPIAAPYLAPKIAALLGGVQIAPGEVAFRNLLLSGLGFSSPSAKMCLDEVMNEVEAQAPKEARLAEDIAALRKAAARAHAIEVLAQVPVGPGYFDEFDPKWWEALREVIPDPTKPADPQDSALDELIDLLPPPLGTIVKFTREADKQMRSIKRHLVDPTLHREIYECYKAQRDADQASRIQAGMGQDALEVAAAHTLLDATADMAGRRCRGAETFKSSYERELSRARTKEEREQEFSRLVRPVAMRFEFIYQVEMAHAKQAELLKQAWTPVSAVLDRLRGRVNACLSRPR
jgi:hypothetical protein